MNWWELFLKPEAIPGWLALAIGLVAVLQHYGFWAWLKEAVRGSGEVIERAGEALLEERKEGQEHLRRMGEARFEAEQQDRGLERAAQISFSESLAEMLRDQIEFNQAVIRHLLQMPEPVRPDNSEVFERLAKALKPPEKKDNDPD